jgi:mRNA-degrading endonuclease toxin of MazEF toxin-antitoxin module
VARRPTSSGAPLKPRRWDIWEVELDPAKGDIRHLVMDIVTPSEPANQRQRRVTVGKDQRAVRACLVISIDALNQSNFGTVIVCPITTTYRESFVWRPGLVPEDLTVVAEDWTAKPNWVETDQIATIDVRFDMRRLLAALVNPRKRAAVSDSVAMMLGLE